MRICGRFAVCRGQRTVMKENLQKLKNVMQGLRANARNDLTPKG
jgi:hypothetical protein